jgi:hypothetical protein
MYSYALLEPSCYYLIREKKDADISLIKINVESDHCVFLSRFQNEETLEWKKKNDPIFDIIELLSDDAVAAWQEAYNATFMPEEEDDEYE